MSRVSVVLFLLTGLFLTRTLQAGDKFPEWRGVNGQGHADATNLPISWSDTKNVAWKTDIPGRGWSTPVIENGQVWVTTAVDIPATKEDAERRRKANTNSQPLRISASVKLHAVGIDLKSGKIIRNVEVLSVKNPQEIHHLNSYASPTPIIENGRLYCHYGSSGIACVDTKAGKVLWRNQTLRVDHANGPGSSPILWKNLLIIHCDGIDQQYIVALDKKTGNQAWKTPRTGELKQNPQLKKSYATSLIVKVNGKPQIISPSADWVYGYEPTTGRELWRLRYGVLGFSNAGRPVAGNGLIYTCTGYMKGEILAIRLEKRGGVSTPTIAWRYKKQVPNVASPLLIGQELYFASDNGVASCIDAKTGKVHWTKRIGRKFWASPLYADGRIYFFGTEGQTTVIATGKTYRKLAGNKLAGKHYATAAAVDGALILRTETSLYCMKSK
jgi:outer membrane protein assembly factor BamB